MDYSKINFDQQIHTPRYHFDSLEKNAFLREMPNRQTNTVLTMGKYQVSIAMDSSHTTGDLKRTEIRVYKQKDKEDSNYSLDVTPEFGKIVAQKMGYAYDEKSYPIINTPVELSIILNHIIEVLEFN